MKLTYTLVVSILMNISAPAYAKPWSIDRYRSCTTTSAQDALSEDVKVSSRDCRQESAVTELGQAPASLDADAFVFAGWPMGANWSTMGLMIVGQYNRLNGVLYDGKGAARLDRLRIMIDGKVIPLESMNPESRLLNCLRRGVVGICSYSTIAAFRLSKDVADALHNAWLNTPDSKVSFRGFFDSGEQFDGEIDLAEFQAVREKLSAEIK